MTASILNAARLQECLALKSARYRFKHADGSDQIVIFDYEGPEGVDIVICRYSGVTMEWNCYFRGEKVGSVPPVRLVN